MAFVGGVALIFFALQALDSARMALFLPRAGAFMWVYVAVSAGGFYVFLCGSLYPLEPRLCPVVRVVCCLRCYCMSSPS